MLAHLGLVAGYVKQEEVRPSPAFSQMADLHMVCRVIPLQGGIVCIDEVVILQ